MLPLTPRNRFESNLRRRKNLRNRSSVCAEGIFGCLHDPVRLSAAASLIYLQARRYIAQCNLCELTNATGRLWWEFRRAVRTQSMRLGPRNLPARPRTTWGIPLSPVAPVGATSARTIAPLGQSDAMVSNRFHCGSGMFHSCADPLSTVEPFAFPISIESILSSLRQAVPSCIHALSGCHHHHLPHQPSWVFGSLRGACLAKVGTQHGCE